MTKLVSEADPCLGIAVADTASAPRQTRFWMTAAIHRQIFGEAICLENPFPELCCPSLSVEAYIHVLHSKFHQFTLARVFFAPQNLAARRNSCIFCRPRKTPRICNHTLVLCFMALTFFIALLLCFTEGPIIDN